MKHIVAITLLSLFIVIANTGIWAMPNLSMQHMVSQSLTKVPFDDPNAHYIYTNYFEPLLFKLLGGKSLLAYALYTLFISTLFFIVFAIWFIYHHGKEVAIHQHKLLLAVTFPLFMIPFYWVGMDGMTLLLMLLIMLSLNRPIVILPAILLGLQHFEQGFSAFLLLSGSLTLSYLISKDKQHLSLLKRLAIITLSILAGKLLLSFWFYFMNVGLSGDRNSYLQNNLELFLSMFKSSSFTILYSLLGVGWIVVATNAKKLWPFLVAVAVVFSLTAIVGDQTRVGLIVLFPSLFFWVMMDKELWQKIKQNTTYLLVALYLLLPVVVVWGAPHGALLKHDLKLLKEYKNNTLDIATFDWLAPFKAEDFKDKAAPLTEYKAKIELQQQLPLYCEENKECKIHLKVTNTSNQTWQHLSSGAYSINLSYHIESKEGQILLSDGIRTPLPHAISSGVTIPLYLEIKKGLQKGHYLIKADMVQESVTWFQKMDSTSSLCFALEIK